MRIIINPKSITCSVCECQFDISEKDICTEIDGSDAYIATPTNDQGKKFVFCPVCHTKIYLKKHE